jgi:hypothetical protein
MTFLTTLKRKFRTFTSQPWSARLLFFEVYLRLGFARASVLTLPFKRLSRRWGVPQLEGLRTPHPEADQRFLRQLIWAVRTARRYTPWDSNCLAQAIAAKQVLRRRGYAGTLYMGVKTAQKSGKGEMEAHAWLRCGDTWICGVRESRGFTVVATFADVAGESDGAQPVSTMADSAMRELK